MTVDVRTRVAQLVAKASDGEAGVTDPSDPKEPISGLDSLALVALIVELENEFDISLPAEDVVPQHFSSIAAIVALIGALRRESALRVYDLIVDGRIVAPKVGTVVDVLLSGSAERPAAPFLTWLPVQGEAEVLTYGELEAQSRALSAWLINVVGRADVKGPIGCRIGLLATNDISTVVALFAIIRVGGVCLFLNPADPVDRVRSILASHPVSLVLRSPGVAGFDDVAVPIKSWPIDAQQMAADAEVITGSVHQPGPSDPAFLFATSGSTAASKVVLQSHRAVLSNARSVQQHHGLEAGDVIAGGLPLHHVNGVHFTVMAVLNAGAHVILPQHFSMLSYRSHLDTYNPVIASVVPSVLESLLATGRGWLPPASLRYFVSAASPMTASLARRVMESFNRRVVQGYGLTETTNFSTMLPVDMSDEDYSDLVLRAEIPSVGVPFADNRVEVLSPAGAMLPDGEVGEVCMRGHNVMDCYVDAPELTAMALADGWFHSGDLGYWHRGPRGGRYLVLTGRMKNVAKVRGESVSLEEVERALCSLEGVEDAGCVAVPHALWGEELVAMVALNSRASLDGLRPQLGRLLSPTAVPRRWLELGSMPRTPTGKLQRDVLLALVAAI